MTVERSPIATRSNVRSRSEQGATASIFDALGTRESAIPGSPQDREGAGALHENFVSFGSNLDRDAAQSRDSHPNSGSGPSREHADRPLLAEREERRLSGFDFPFSDKEGFVRRRRCPGIRVALDRGCFGKILVVFLIGVVLIAIVVVLVNHIVKQELGEIGKGLEEMGQSAKPAVEFYMRGFRCFLTSDGTICRHSERQECVRLRSGETARSRVVDAIPAAGVEIPACGGFRVFFEV